MSELGPQAAQLFERLEQSMIDPHVTMKTELANEYEQLINETQCSQKEWVALAADLDKDWAYLGVNLKVSGTLWYESPDTGRLERRKVENLDVCSQGFYFDPERIELDGEYLDGLLRATHIFSFDIDHPHHKAAIGMMHFDDIKHIEYPFPSLELRRQRFPLNQADIADEIDEAILNADDDNEKVRRMREFGIAINLSKSEEVETLEDAQAYIDHIIELDKDLPFYHLQILGGFGFLRGEEGMVRGEITQTIRRVVTVKQVSLHPDNLYDSTEGSQRFVPCLDVVVHGRAQGDVSREAIIPFSSIMWAESIRTAS